MIPVRTRWIPAARRGRVRMTTDQKRLAHRQASAMRMLAAAAVRGVVPVWRAAVVAPVVAWALKAHRSKHGPRVDAWDDEDDLDDIDLEPAYSFFVSNAQRIVKNQTQLQKSLGAKLGIKPSSQSARVQTALVKARQDAQALIKKAKGDFIDDVKGVLNDPETVGLRVEELRDLLMDRGKVSESRAELIARDQTYKTNAAITRAHHEDAGITSYIWSTSLDERVRPEHEDLEGQIFQYTAPPDEGNPGDPINCRCVAVPVDDEGNETDDEGEDD